MKGTLKSIALVAAGFVAGGLVCSSTDEDEDEGGPPGLVIQEPTSKVAVPEDPSADSSGGAPIPEASGEGIDGPREEEVGNGDDRGSD